MLIELGYPGGNGYSEFFDESLRHKLLDREIFYTRQKTQILIEQSRRHYNAVRRHRALNYRHSAPETRGFPIGVLASILVLAFRVGLH